jgi:hypothetical protein
MEFIVLLPQFDGDSESERSSSSTIILLCELCSKTCKSLIESCSKTINSESYSVSIRSGEHSKLKCGILLVLATLVS